MGSAKRRIASARAPKRGMESGASDVSPAGPRARRRINEYDTASTLNFRASLAISAWGIFRWRADFYTPQVAIVQQQTTALDFLSKKVLIKKTHFPCSALPSLNVSRETRETVQRRRRKRAFLLKLFSEKFGKSIDGPKRECSLEHLSLTRKRFFEIYFVRLIGTPNQHIPKHELRFVSCHLRMTGF